MPLSATEVITILQNLQTETDRAGAAPGSLTGSEKRAMQAAAKLVEDYASRLTNPNPPRSLIGRVIHFFTGSANPEGTDQPTEEELTEIKGYAEGLRIKLKGSGDSEGYVGAIEAGALDGILRTGSTASALTRMIEQVEKIDSNLALPLFMPIDGIEVID